ncbi:N-formylglutamate deformylase [Dyella sp.]|jgi:N-formylglutamate deformylase|uniref:N-formylglutamate deformylase n=1 Tax=Dyella sp. TaxID=1869338 RepID=UPI002D10862D|nr:N-formylglutamate deformylase [Dyella sp.]HTC26508.1 N-formylglutamate deformylase [Dyella sp.]
MDTFTLTPGSAPLLISLPHNGSFIPDDQAKRMYPRARRSPDTDWHVAQLYEPLAADFGASVIKPVASRYVIDLNRPADGHALYPGRRETGLVPTISFDGEPLYFSGQEPTAEEIQQRVETWWRPYHQALAQEIARLLEEHGRVVLWEGHSIRSHVPMLFEGRLPDFNLGTADGASCGADLQWSLTSVMEAQSRYDFVLNGRFKGGYITRQYGKPLEGIQAIQLELAQCQYMNEESFAWDASKAPMVQSMIRRLLEKCLDQPEKNEI